MSSSNGKYTRFLETAKGVALDPSLVEKGFETRLLHRLAMETAPVAPDLFNLTGLAAWRGLPAFAALAALILVWVMITPVQATADFSQIFSAADLDVFNNLIGG